MTEAYRRGFLTKCAEFRIGRDASAALLKAAQQYYSVAKGDILGRIAGRYGVPVEDIMSANGITDPDRLRVGQRLRIPSAQPEYFEYPVAAGDTLGAIAARYGTAAEALASLNGISDPDRISVGQKIRIPHPKKPAAPVPAPKPAPPPVPAAKMSPADIARAEAVKLVQPFVQNHEGFRDRAYWDEAAKRWAIGYGQTEIDGRLVRQSDVIDRARAAAFTKGRLGEGYDWLMANMPRFSKMGPGAKALLMDLWYNAKPSTLTPDVSKNLHAHLLDEKAYPNPDTVVWEEYPTYSKAGGVESEGLANRRADGIAEFMPERPE